MDIYGIFENNVKIYPKQIMIQDENIQLTYEEVYRLVNCYAEKINNVTKGEQTRILLYLNHSYKIIIAILSVLKTGNSYIPIAISKYNNRLKEISKIAQTNIVITDTQFCDEDYKMIKMNDDLEINIQLEIVQNHYIYKNEDEIYVLFTSGSTGIPKGVSVTYGNLLYLMKNMISLNKSYKNIKYCFSTSYTFDVSVTEIFSFVYGKSIYVYDIAKYENYRNFPETIYQNKITHLAFSPSGFKNMILAFNEKQLRKMNQSIKCLMLAGETFKKDIFVEWKNNNWNFDLWNMYGPTEATVYATAFKLSKDADYPSSIPIGQVLEDVTYFIDQKDERGIGELVLGGKGISGGYINNDDENNKKFININNKRYYQTGDLFSEDKHGILYVHGRNDDQVQLNGIRVELGEIESRILGISEVVEAVVLYYQKKLIAFIQVRKNIDLRSKLVKILPRYMIPNIIQYVSDFPLNTNNKIDRKKLLNDYIENEENRNTKISVSAGNLADEILKLMKESLASKGTISNIEDDFYECGADSLNTFFLLNKIEEMLGIQLNVDVIYQLRTPQKIANYVQNSNDITFKNQSIVTVPWDKLVHLSSLVKKYLYNEDLELNDKYQALYLQGYYYNNNLDSTVSFTFDINDDLDINKVKKLIIHLLKCNPILFSKLSLENDILYFNEYEVMPDSFIPYIDLNNCNEEVLKFIKENYQSDLYYSRYHGGLLSLFIIVKQEKKYTIVGILDHTIADAATVSLLKHQLSEQLLDKKFLPIPTFKEYCTQIFQKNKNIEQVLNHWYIELLKNSAIHNREYIFGKTMESEYFTVDITGHDISTNLDVTRFLSYIIGSRLSKTIEQDTLSLRTMVNLRECDNFKFSQTVGDLHCSISMFWKNGNSKEEFDELSEKVIHLFAQEYFRHSSFLSNRSNVDSSAKEILKKITDSADFISINYGGTIDEKQLLEYKKSVPEMQKKLFNISPRIYVTAYLSKDKLHIFMNKKLE